MAGVVPGANPWYRLCFCVLLGLSMAMLGCHSMQTREDDIIEVGDVPIPRELSKVSLPSHLIEPPDILLIEAVRIVPTPPYHLEALDSLMISVLGTIPEQPISGIFRVTEAGEVKLGPSYGSAKVIGLTVEQAKDAIDAHLKKILESPQVSVVLAESRPQQLIAGEHLVRPDGTINLGTYGKVHVTSMTLEQAKVRIENHLTEYLVDPEITIDVLAYNSKVCYVIFDGAGFGEEIIRLPVTGSETVLDVMSTIGGLPQVASKKSEMWVARPAPEEECCDQILPVDWCAITQRGSPKTNYQIFPGDRIYVKADRLTAFDQLVSRVTAPMERMMGFTLLGYAFQSTLNQGTTSGRGIGGGGVGGF